jgi:hypothetical protein
MKRHTLAKLAVIAFAAGCTAATASASTTITPTATQAPSTTQAPQTASAPAPTSTTVSPTTTVAPKAPTPTTTAPPTTTTTTVPSTTTELAKPATVKLELQSQAGQHQMCPEWHQAAAEAGWQLEHIAKLSYIMWRESRCDTSAHNTKDPTPDGSRGLVQINGYWCRKNTHNPEGFLQKRGILQNCTELHNPATNLKAALAIWQYGRDLGRSGWGPWAVK